MLNMSNWIDNICDTVSTIFTKFETPFPQLPRLLLVSSLIKRPGLSRMKSVTNIAKNLNKFGIPTDEMPDGTDNYTLIYTAAIIDEVFRAIKEDASVQVGTQPGSIRLTAFGANAGGPVKVDGINMSPGMSFGLVN